MPTDPSATPPDRSSDPSSDRSSGARRETGRATDPGAHDVPDVAAAPARPSLLDRVGADWAAVVVAGVLVLLAGLGLLPSIPFLIR